MPEPASMASAMPWVKASGPRRVGFRGLGVGSGLGTNFPDFNLFLASGLNMKGYSLDLKLVLKPPSESTLQTRHQPSLLQDAVSGCTQIV